MADSGSNVINNYQQYGSLPQRLFQPRHTHESPSRNDTSSPNHPSTPSHTPNLSYNLTNSTHHDSYNSTQRYSNQMCISKFQKAQDHLHSTNGLNNQHSFSSRNTININNNNSLIFDSSSINSPHWQQQLSYAKISRQSNSPHHHAKTAAVTTHTISSNSTTVTDPNNSNKASMDGIHRKDGPPVEKQDVQRNNEGKIKRQDWTNLDMGGMGLRNISRELFRYTFLTSLYINHNKLLRLPPDIGRLRLLTQLDVSGNSLTSLPPEIGMLTNLRELLFFDNQITNIPPEFGTLYQLETLGLEGNPLPDSFKSLLAKDGTKSLIYYLRDIPLPPPEREWITFPGKKSENSSHENETFTVFNYNILCDRCATIMMYGYTPSWALSWDYRRELILHEVLSYNADIEVDVDNFEEYFSPKLSIKGYKGLFWPKSRARTMNETERRVVDGCATFFKTCMYQLIEFNQAPLRRDGHKLTHDMYNRVMTKDNICVVSLLEHRKAGYRLIIANTHFYWDPKFRDVKVIQATMLMDELAEIAENYAKIPTRRKPSKILNDTFDFEWNEDRPTYSLGTKIPLIICGDFNSIPGSGVYDFLSRGHIFENHSDFMDSKYGTYTTDGRSHPFQLKSSYNIIGELPFTNYTPGFSGVIDYIWHTTNSLEVIGLLQEVDRQYLNGVVGFPNAHFPSDHISILAEFKFLSEFNTFLFDCDGVLWKGTKNTLNIEKILILIGKNIAFVTNDSSKTREEYQKKFLKLGIKVNMNEIFNSSYSAALYLKNIIKFPKEKKVYVLGEEGVEKELDKQEIKYIGGTDPIDRRDIKIQDFENLNIDPSVGAVLCGLDLHINYLKYSKALRYLQNKNTLFLATNSDSTYPTSEGLFPGTGSCLAPLLFASGRKPVFLGKPSLEMLNTIESTFKFNKSKTCFIGDRIDTDILFARNSGIKSCLVLTGISTEDDILKNTSNVTPDYCIKILADLLDIDEL
ncbi:hypothetical protein PCANB_001209 [Pneumocystis canis]|nr:hypothetical protein PCANB_001209 [Pneumocystis canis]